MDEQMNNSSFYETFWADAQYQFAYAFDSAVRDRYPAIQKVWGDVRKPNRVLDYGCGNGVLTYWLWCNGFGNEIVGVDVSQTGIANARRAFGDKPGLRFETLDAYKRIDPGSFDVVVCSHVLEHCKHPEETLAMIAEMAEWLVLEVPLENCLWPELSARLRGRARKDNPVGHVKFWNKASFKALLRSAGLLVVREYQYVSAPFSPFSHPAKRWLERLVLKILDVRLYGALLATHYTVLARRMTPARVCSQ